MDIQRIRTLTTGRLHTKIEHIYEDIEFITGAAGIMTHQLPNALLAIGPWLRENLTDMRLWDGQWDTSHTGNIDLQPMNQEEQDEMWKRYAGLASQMFSKGA